MSTNLSSYKIVPILGRKTDVSPDDLSMFQYLSDGVFLTHDCGGVNFSLSRRRNSCMKSYGYEQFSNTAASAEARCLGLFELYDGTNRDHIRAESGSLFAYDGSNDPVIITSSDFASDNIDLYSMNIMMISIGAGNASILWGEADANAISRVTLFGW